MARTGPLLLLAALLATARPGSAAADATRPAAAGAVAVAILGLEAVDAPEEAAEAVTVLLRQRAAAHGGVRLLSGAKELVEVKLIFGCMEERPGCLAQAGHSLGADRILYGSVRRARDVNGYTVVLKELDVKAGRIDRFVSDVVPGRTLHKESAELVRLVQRWLDVLLLKDLHGGVQIGSEPPGCQVMLDGVDVGKTPLVLHDVPTGQHVAVLALPGYEQVVRSFEVKGGLVHDLDVKMARRGQPAGGLVEAGPAPPPSDRGRPLRLTSYFLFGAAALAGAVSIYTWRTYVGDQDKARAGLDTLQMNLPGAGPEVNDFFHSPDRLSSCQPPPELTRRAMDNATTLGALNDYLDHCEHGKTYASASTGLLATMGSLALLGVVTYIVGHRLGHPGRKSGPDDAYKANTAASSRPSWLYTPRLQLVSPTIHQSGGGLNLSFQF